MNRDYTLLSPAPVVDTAAFGGVAFASVVRHSNLTQNALQDTIRDELSSLVMNDTLVLWFSGYGARGVNGDVSFFGSDIAPPAGGCSRLAMQITFVVSVAVIVGVPGHAVSACV